MAIRKNKTKPVSEHAEEDILKEDSVPTAVPMRRSRQVKKEIEVKKEPESFFGTPLRQEEKLQGEEEDDDEAPVELAGDSADAVSQGLFSFTEEKKAVDLSQDDFDLEIEDEEDILEELAEEPEETKEEQTEELPYWVKRTPHSVKAAISNAAAIYRRAVMTQPGDSLPVETEDNELLIVDNEGVFELPSVRVYEDELPAGWDSNLEVKLQMGKQVVIDTGVKLAIPQGFCLEVTGCSDMLTKYGLICVESDRAYSNQDLGTNVCIKVEAVSSLSYVPRHKNILRARLQRN